MRDHMDPVLGRALEDVYGDLVTAERPAPGFPGPSRPGGARPRTIWVTVVVGVVVVLAAAFAIRAGTQTSRPAISPTSRTTTTTTVLSDAALLAKLPKQPYGRIVHTWTDHDATDTSGPFSLVGSTAVIAATCSGGGTISMKRPDRAANRLSCATLGVQQPGWSFNLGGDGKPTRTTAPIHVTVKVLSGAPHYVVRLWAVDPRILDSDVWSVGATGASVPKSLRTCTAADIAPQGTLDPTPKSHSAVVTITSRGTTDCAIRSWPTMQYLSADAAAVGPLEGKDNNGKSLDSSEGAVNKYGEFPPARLVAGGTAFLIVDLTTEAALLKEDAEMKAMPTPTTGPVIRLTPCKPEAVGSIRLTIGGATVSVPTPAALKAAACRTSTRDFGVGPVVTTRPAAQ